MMTGVRKGHRVSRSYKISRRYDGRAVNVPHLVRMLKASSSSSFLVPFWISVPLRWVKVPLVKVDSFLGNKEVLLHSISIHEGNFRRSYDKTSEGDEKGGEQAFRSAYSRPSSLEPRRIVARTRTGRTRSYVTTEILKNTHPI